MNFEMFDIHSTKLMLMATDWKSLAFHSLPAWIAVLITLTTSFHINTSYTNYLPPF